MKLPNIGSGRLVRDIASCPLRSPVGILRRVIRRRVLLVLFYCAITAVMVSPYTNFRELDSASYEGDARLIIWTLGGTTMRLMTRHLLFDSNTFYPAAKSLSYNEHLVGLSLFTLPIYAATGNPVLAYNVVWLLSFVLNGLAAHAMLKRFVTSDLSAATGSLIYTFSFYKMLHAHGHLHLVWTWLIPLSVIALERWLDRPTIGRAFAWAIGVVLQALTSWYLAVMVVMVQAIMIAGGLHQLWRKQRLSDIWQLATVTALAAAVVWPFAEPYRALPQLNLAKPPATPLISPHTWYRPKIPGSDSSGWLN